MDFFLPTVVYKYISNNITTELGKPSLPTQIKYLYIVHHIVHFRTFKKTQYENKGVPLNAALLTKLFGTGAEVKQILMHLQEMNFIIKVRNTVYKEKSAVYKLHENLESATVFKFTFDANDSKLISKVIEHNKQSQIPNQKQLNILRNNITLNAKGIDFFECKYGLKDITSVDIEVSPRDIILNLIRVKSFFAHRKDLKSRIYTNLTSLPRDHRDYISFDGKPMLMTDISNSQILLTVPLLISGWREISGDGGRKGLPKDIIDFQVLAESGMFYEHIAKLSNLDFKDSDERGKFKKKVFEEIWFSKVSKRKTKIKSIFVKHFPTVYRIISHFKGNNHADFAIKLQRFEASIIVNKVWEKMHKMGKKVLTLHDAIICNDEENLTIAENLIRQELSVYNISPKFKRE